ncbi:hypothetical protein LguiB_001570 [Lonicera macranthoides]
MPCDNTLFSQPAEATPTEIILRSPPPDPAPVGSLRRSQFPSGFTFGSAASAFQIEGAVNKDGRGCSIWDTYAKKHCLPYLPSLSIHLGLVGLVGWEQAVDHYHRYRDDVKIMKNIGFDAYRFSISWPRILPKGTKAGGVNPAGIAFYNNLINELIDKGCIKPVATLFHWDLPQVLEDKYGGFRDRQIIEDFQNYADVCFKEFGDRVKTWITLNEPWSFSYGGYAVGTLAPGRGYKPVTHKEATSIEDLRRPCRCSFSPSSSRRASTTPDGDPGSEPPFLHGFVSASSRPASQGVTHPGIALAADSLHFGVLMESEASEPPKGLKTYKGEIGISLVTIWQEPYSKEPCDVMAAERAQDFTVGWFMDPITKGDYPQSMQKLVGQRLPKFTKEESLLLKGSFDFLGLNYYTANYVQDASNQGINKNPHYETDSMVTHHRLNEKNDRDLPIAHFLFDEKRITYYHDHLHYIKVAIE